MNNISADKLRRCSDEALKAYGTAYIFEKRASKLRQNLLFLSFFGIASPVSVGAIISTYSLDSATTEKILFIAGSIAIIQLLLTLWSFVSNWNNKLTYSIESKASNYSLSLQFINLSYNTSISAKRFDVELKILDKETELRTSLDNQVDITEKEKRMGMRYGLRKFQRACVGCNIVPIDMKLTSCGVCGKI